MLFSRGKKRTILFADVSGSSALYKAEGNEKAKSIIDEIIKMLVHNTGKYRGRVVKTIGDEIMSCFDKCEDACRAAIEMQQASDAFDHTHTLGIRIGIGYGKTLEEGNDLFGEAVNDAAFVTGIAKSSQILLTDSVIAQLPERLKQSTQVFDQVAIKGATDRSTIHRLFWKPQSGGFSETQVFSAEDVSAHLDDNTLTLWFGEQSYQVQSRGQPFIIGRHHQQVSLYVDSELVSRDHCHIVFRRGKFVLIDHSTNGTYIQPEDAQEIYLRREELPLLGNGSISLGIAHSAPNAPIIRFQS
ncbi:MAG: adenylate/guanylate cyclase domain-containing protein [Gammaproteobacteria bacterium]|nr:adenylate/guanylate cyclase domain-containing protein [Gammaproteobacteria bacterium]NVK87519.1 adenylate/guanylate cyclase domain-containing protein [Gammaproteobacteria bacterium]